MKPLAAILTLLILAAAGVLAFPPHRDVVTTIGIAAPPDRVWQVLTDTEDYPAWTRDMALKGALVAGRVIEYDQGQGSDRMAFHPTIVAATPSQELSWRGEVGLPRILAVLHYFRLEKRGEHTLLTQGENLSGVLLYVFDADQLLPTFRAVNAQLKAHLEPRFPSVAPPPTSRP